MNNKSLRHSFASCFQSYYVPPNSGGSMYSSGRCDYGIDDVPCSASLQPIKACSLSINYPCLMRFFTLMPMHSQQLLLARVWQQQVTTRCRSFPFCVNLQATCTPPLCTQMSETLVRCQFCVYQLVQFLGLAKLLGRRACQQVCKGFPATPEYPSLAGCHLDAILDAVV